LLENSGMLVNVESVCFNRPYFISDLQKDRYRSIPDDLSYAMECIADKPYNLARNIQIGYGICLCKLTGLSRLFL